MKPVFSWIIRGFVIRALILSMAGMAELVDALDSKSSEGNFMGVRFPLPAPSNFSPYLHYPSKKRTQKCVRFFIFLAGMSNRDCPKQADLHKI